MNAPKEKLQNISLINRIRDTKKISCTCISGDVRLFNYTGTFYVVYTSIPRDTYKLSVNIKHKLFASLLLVYITVKHSSRWPLIVFIAYKHYNFKSDSFARSDCSNEGYKHLLCQK